MRLPKYLPLLLLVTLALLVWLSGIHPYWDFAAVQAQHQSLALFIAQNQLLSILAYCSSYLLVVALSLPGATFMTLIGGLFFGQWLGTGCTVISATLGASILFLSAKMASTNLLRQKAGAWVSKMQQGFQHNAFSYLLALRLIPLFPFVAINLVTALLQIPFRTFFFATLLGIIPGSFVYTAMGVALRTVIQQPNFTPSLILERQILVALIGLGILALLPVLYKRYHSHQSK